MRGVSFLQILQREAFARDRQLLLQLGQGIGAPVLRPVEQDANRFNGEWVGGLS